MHSAKPHTIYEVLGGWTWSILLILTLMFSVASVHAQSPATESVAEINGDTITTDELNRTLGARLAQLEEQVYNLKSRELDVLIAQRLLAQEAATRGISVPTLLDAEVTAKVGLVTEKEIEDFYQANKARIRGDEADTRQKIRAFLQQQKLVAQRELFVQSLRSKAKVVVYLQPPPVIRVDVPVELAPVRGAAEAPVTVVEFSDFECPFCKQMQGTLQQLLERYPGKVRLVYRDLPLETIHPYARRAAEAARCAQDQGKFWDYHDILFTKAPKLAPDDLKQYAAEVGLDAVEFEACLGQGIHSTAVQHDVDESKRLGITGTPAFFINGRPLQGAQPIEAFTQVIEDELTRFAASQSGPH